MSHSEAQIPGYRILRRLGRGGMATVYLASQESLARLVAVKVLDSECVPNAEQVQRFENEARTIARLDHPHIVSIFDVGRTPGGQIFYTMPYLPHGDLAARRLHENPLRVLEIVRALAEALGSAHKQGIVHRDVKPENVLFDAQDRPMLADFGIALSGGDLPRVTREGATVGSSGYMSPEQARGQPLDGRSDLYSLGVVCYEMLTGEMPFLGVDALAVALAHIEKPIPRLPVTRRAWQPLIDRALAKQPEARLQNADEWLAALDVIGKRLHGPVRRGPAGWWQDLLERAVAMPHRLRAAALCALLLILGALLAALPRAPERAASAGAWPVTAPARAAPVSAVTPADDTPTRADALSDIQPERPSDAEAAATRTQRLHEAKGLIARGHLVTPGGDNAAERYLAILADEPGQRDAVAGLQRVLVLLAEGAAASIAAGDGGAAIAPIAQGSTVAARAKLVSAPAFAAFVAPIHRAIEQRRARPRDPLDSGALADLKPLLATLARIDSAQARALQADFDTIDALLRGQKSFHDRDGPEMIVVRGRLEPAFAIAVDDSSRGAYALFAASSGRAPARCRESPNLFARSKGLDWRHPGFAQGDDHPVVCVSWDDASAYARWLSQRSGAHYRLATRQEWRAVAQAAGTATDCSVANIGTRSGAAAGCDDGYAQTAPRGRYAATPPGIHDIVGNVSTWIDGCAKPVRKDDRCRDREFRGLSWRDDDGSANLDRADTSAGDVGYVDVGFRLVRELPAGAALP